MPAVLSRLARPPRTPARQIEFFNKGIDRSDRIVLGDPIFQPLWKQH